MSTIEKKVKGKALSNEQAITDVTNFLKVHKEKEFRRNKLTQAVIEDDYEDVIEAVEDGLLVFEKGVAKYNLRHGLTDVHGEVTGEPGMLVTFKSRIRPGDKLNVLNGMNVEKQQGDHIKRQLALASQLNLGIIEKLHKEDFDVLMQIASVF